jgi:ADP-ribose pyrophosphatase YjhB (NUDIX family)
MRRSFSASTFPIFDQTVLLIRHNMLKLWLPPGGELEIRPMFQEHDRVTLAIETPIETAKRELKEETQLDAWWVHLTDQQGEPPGYLGYGEHQAGPKGLHMNFDFMAFAKSQEVIGDGSFSEHAWFNLSEVEDLEGTTQSVKQFVQRIIGITADQRIMARLALAQMRGE